MPSRNMTSLTLVVDRNHDVDGGGGSGHTHSRVVDVLVRALVLGPWSVLEPLSPLLTQTARQLAGHRPSAQLFHTPGQDPQAVHGRKQHPHLRHCRPRLTVEERVVLVLNGCKLVTQCFRIRKCAVALMLDSGKFLLTQCFQIDGELLTQCFRMLELREVATMLGEQLPYRFEKGMRQRAVVTISRQSAQQIGSDVRLAPDEDYAKSVLVREAKGRVRHL